GSGLPLGPTPACRPRPGKDGNACPGRGDGRDSGDPQRSHVSPPAADRVRDRDDELVEDLLAAYDDVRRTASDLPRVVWMRATPGRVGRRLRVPLPTANLDVLLRHHLVRTVGALKRRHHALMALEPSDGIRARLDALDHYEQSIAPPPIRLLLLALVLAALLVAF